MTWRKRETNYVESWKQQWRILGAKYAQLKSDRSKERPKCNRCGQRKRRKQNLLCMWEVGPYSQKLLGEVEKGKGSRNATEVSKRQWRTVSSQLASNNLYSVLHPEKLGNKLNSTNTTKRAGDVWRTLQPLREVWMKVGLEKLENHEGVAVKALLDSRATGLFMDTTFAKEKGFKMEKLKNPLLVRNVDGMANVEGAITH